MIQVPDDFDQMRQENAVDLEKQTHIEFDVGDLMELGRLGFVRKVYGILSVQLLATVIICGLSTYYQSFAIWYLAATPLS